MFIAGIISRSWLGVPDVSLMAIMQVHDLFNFLKDLVGNLQNVVKQGNAADHVSYVPPM